MPGNGYLKPFPVVLLHMFAQLAKGNTLDEISGLFSILFEAPVNRKRKVRDCQRLVPARIPDFRIPRQPSD